MSQEKVNNLLLKIEALKTEIDSYRPISKELEARIFQKLRLDWNYHSNAIEGNTLSQGETRAFIMEGLTAKGKPLKDHLDIKGHNDAIDFILSMIKNSQYFTEKDIRELHKLILVEPYTSKAETKEGIPTQKIIKLGKYKSSANHVKTATGEIHYYATPEETPAKMNDLMTWFRENEEKYHPLILASLFHYRFVNIHPFDDGNGRMSRLLMNFILMKYNFPPVVIKKEDRDSYYFALRNADAGDQFAFIEYIGENLIHSLEIYLKGAKGESIEEQGDFEKELLLFKKKIEANKIHRNLAWSVEEQEKLNRIYKEKVFNALILKANSFNDLFIENTVYIYDYEEVSGENNNSRGFTLGSKRSFESEYDEYNRTVEFEDYYADYSITNINNNKRYNIFIFHFIDNKFSKFTFSLEFQLFFLFDKYKYRLFYNFTGLNKFIETRDFVNRNQIEDKQELPDKDKLIFEKNYGEYLSDTEIDEISEKVGKLLLKAIKKKQEE